MASLARARNRGQSPTDAFGTARLSYPGTLLMLAVALAFPIALMVFNPTLMFERGWEQYVGTAIYAWAVLTLEVYYRYLPLYKLDKDEAKKDLAAAK